MSTTLTFVFGAVTGILIQKIIGEAIASRRRAKLIKTCLETAQKTLEKMTTSSEDDEDNDSDSDIDIHDELMKLRQNIDKL